MLQTAQKTKDRKVKYTSQLEGQLAHLHHSREYLEAKVRDIKVDNGRVYEWSVEVNQEVRTHGGAAGCMSGAWR